MPIYTFYNKRTKKQFDDMMTIAEMEEYLKKNKHISQVISGINIVASTGERTNKTDSGWKENLSRIAEAHPRSNLAKRYGKKTIKQVKTEQVIKKLEGDIEVAKADLRTFLDKPIGVAEHIDYVDTAEKKLDKLAHAEDKLESLLKL